MAPESGKGDIGVVSARELVVEAVGRAVEAAGLDIGTERISLERPNDPSHGDLSCNIAMTAAGRAGRKPRELADEIVKNISFESSFVERVEVAGPGFINFTFALEYLTGQIALINSLGGSYGDSTLGGGGKVQVEFVSANPTGPLVVVSARAAAVGNALANVLRKAGFEVQTEYYLNDAGSQVRKLGLSLMARFEQRLGRNTGFPDDGYPGGYLIDIAGDIDVEEGEGWLGLEEEEAASAFGDFALERIIGQIKEDLDLFGVQFDVFFRESSLHAEGGDIDRALGIMKKHGATYERDGAVWFKSSEFGDEKDRVLVRSDESPTYFLADAAYHLNKLDRSFSHVIDIFGPDHHGHIKRLQAASSVFGADENWLDVMTVQWVRLIEEGKPVSMSKREGEFVTLRDLALDVGPDASKFFFLLRKTNAHLDFDLTLARKESDDNPVYYVQYAHARISSVIAFANDEGVRFPDDTSCVELLREPEEIDLMRKLVIFPQLIEGAALSREPHRLTFYARQLAASFHHFYHICRIVSKDRRLSEARLLLSEATRIVLAESLRILGVTAPEKM